MKLWTHIFIMSIACLEGVVEAGDMKGNGGDIVVCNDGDEVFLFDYFHEMQSGHQMLLGSDDLSVPEKVRFVLDRISKIDPYRSEKLLANLSEFFQQVEFVNHDFGTFSSRPVEGFPNCFKKRVAENFPNKYKVNVIYWNLLNKDSKAGLVLHEIIWRDLVYHPMYKSDSYFRPYRLKAIVGAYNKLIVNPDISQTSRAEYVDSVNKIEFPTLENVFDFPLIAGSIFHLASGELRCGKLFDELRVGPRNQKLLLGSHGSTVCLNGTRGLRFIDARKPYNLPIKGIDQPAYAHFNAGPIFFDDDGYAVVGPDVEKYNVFQSKEAEKECSMWGCSCPKTAFATGFSTSNHTCSRISFIDGVNQISLEQVDVVREFDCPIGYASIGQYRCAKSRVVANGRLFVLQLGAKRSVVSNDPLTQNCMENELLTTASSGASGRTYDMDCQAANVIEVR